MQHLLLFLSEVARAGAIVLRLVPETLLVSMRFHALAALVFGNFRFASFLKRAHSVFQFCEW
jgi:hypothetical protein